MGYNQTVVSFNLTGISPLWRSAEVLPIACDAFNARTVAVREYHYIFCVSSPISCYTYFRRSVYRSASLCGKEKRHGALNLWLGAKGTYLICPILRRRYLAGFLCQRAKGWNEQSAKRGVRFLFLTQTLNERTAFIRRDRKLSHISSSMTK